MQFPDLSALPMAGQIVIYAILGLCIAVGFLVTRMGLLQGLKAAAPSVSSAQVAAVIVDPSALNAATAAVKGLTTAILEANQVAREHAQKTERMADEIDRLREEMRVLMARRNGP